MGVKADYFGPSFQDLGGWVDQLLLPNKLVTVTDRNEEPDAAAGTWTVQAVFRYWTTAYHYLPMKQDSVTVAPNCGHSMAQNTILYLNGDVEDRGDAAPLSGRGSAEDGRTIVTDEVALSDGVLTIRHQRAHALNDRWGALPPVELQPVTAQGRATGFAALTYGASGALLKTEFFIASGWTDSQLREILGQAGRTLEAVGHSHDHTLYFAFRIEDGWLMPQGRGWIT